MSILSKRFKPCNLNVLKRFFYGHKIENKSINDSANAAAYEVMKIWKNENVDLIKMKNVSKKIKTLYLSWKNLKKNKNKKSETEITKRNRFIDELSLLFEITRKTQRIENKKSRKYLNSKFLDQKVLFDEINKISTIFIA